MKDYFDKTYFENAAAALPPEWFAFKPVIGVILGSGWGQALLDEPYVDAVSYADIPGYGASTVMGHAGEARILEVGGRHVIAFCGRRHFYEGEGWGPVVMPVELMRRLGVGRVTVLAP